MPFKTGIPNLQDQMPDELVQAAITIIETKCTVNVPRYPQDHLPPPLSMEILSSMKPFPSAAELGTAALEEHSVVQAVYANESHYSSVHLEINLVSFSL